ncbi:dihydrofolate reductase family protein [Arsenicibacter rosenii]|uniref:Dihydrofolate reductase n=1 Tax=Arsenicibacter rosenii TaxID=1750698 RepID=A0A1S2VNT6_9BACT|nr:dihydrofolate reductase family protein [Arsenicibacter rosenii]OIN59875.1 dihydrofolate reductase [Arsenicibacter rosenii]
MQSSRNVILFIAMSLDGYIATPNDGLEFLSIVEQEGEDYGYGAFVQGVDTVILGRKTYDKVMTLVSEFPHANKNTYIITRTPREAIGSVQFYTGNLIELVTRLKQEAGKDIFVDGGAEVVHEMLTAGLIDEFYISVIPILLGDGIPLFKPGFAKTNLTLISAKSFEKGLTQLHYKRS